MGAYSDADGLKAGVTAPRSHQLLSLVLLAGSLSVGIIEPRGALTPYNFSAGSAVVIPSGGGMSSVKCCHV